MLKISKLIIGVSVLLLFSGCASLPARSGEGEVAVYKRFSDLPLPEGAKFIFKDSFVFENAAVRLALLKYRLNLPAPKAAAYFRQNMKSFGWSLDNCVEAQEELLNFHNNQESCFITIIAKGSSSLAVIRILPRASAALEEQKEK